MHDFALEMPTVSCYDFEMDKNSLDHALRSDAMDEAGEVVGFMCLTEWQHDIASGRARVFSTLGELQDTLLCTSQCGVIEVKLVPARIVIPARL